MTAGAWPLADWLGVGDEVGWVVSVGLGDDVADWSAVGVEVALGVELGVGLDPAFGSPGSGIPGGANDEVDVGDGVGVELAVAGALVVGPGVGQTAPTWKSRLGPAA
ncbi:MAG: hypothetical protein ACTHK4_04240, partial [Mycobacteriales bacterium]